MEKKLYEAFNELKMDESCANRIRKQMSKANPARRIIRYSVIAAACMLVIILLCANPNVVQALENTLDAIDEAIGLRSNADTDTPGTPPEVVYSRPDGSAVFEDESNEVHVISPEGIMPLCLVETEEGVFFTGNGENIELTDLLSEEVPFTYVFTDDDGIMHYIAIGLFTAKGEQHVGYHEWLRNASEAGEGKYSGWISGGGGMIPNDPEEEWVWLESAKEEFGVPWS